MQFPVDKNRAHRWLLVFVDWLETPSLIGRRVRNAVYAVLHVGLIRHCWPQLDCVWCTRGRPIQDSYTLEELDREALSRGEAFCWDHAITLGEAMALQLHAGARVFVVQHLKGLHAGRYIMTILNRGTRVIGLPSGEIANA